MSEPQDVQVKGSTAQAAASAGSLKILIWQWYSLDQAIAATTFSRKCGELEANSQQPNDSERAAGFTWSLADQREHRSYVIASILSSVAFLEASINELYASASDPIIKEVGGELAEAERSRLADVAEFIERDRTLARFQLTLHLLGKEPFDRGRQPYQNADTLVKLRNELVHYKPRHRSGGDQFTNSDKWLQSLYQKKFSPNPFTGTANPFFPDRCLSHGCTVWAWNAALAFANDFFSRVGVTPIHDAHRELLRPS
jgi:hypothetical protein